MGCFGSIGRPPAAVRHQAEPDERLYRQGPDDRRVFGEVHSDRSAGKTAILVDLLLHVAAGLEYRGRRVVQQPVVYVALEGHKGIGNRVFAARGNWASSTRRSPWSGPSRNFREPETAKKVAEVARRLMNTFGGDCPVIAIDTFTAALGAGTSDCDPKDVTKFIANMQQHLLATCTVIIAHHFGKDSSRGGRGWSGLGAALDFELEIDRDGDLRTMRVTKARDGSDRQPALCYNLVGREIGVNEDDDPVTAVVVEHLADQAEPSRGKRHSPKARARAQRPLGNDQGPGEVVPDPGSARPALRPTRRLGGRLHRRRRASARAKKSAIGGSNSGSLRLSCRPHSGGKFAVG